MNDSQNSTPSLSIGRVPIFDAQRRLWGYELICVGTVPVRPEASSEEDTAASVAASAYIGLQPILKQGRKVMLNFDEMGIVDNMPYALPPDNAAVQVAEDLFLNPEIPAILQRLKSDGYLIAVQEFSGAPEFEPLYELADIVGATVAGKKEKEVADLLAAIDARNTDIMARRVDDAAMFELCRQAGADLFEGAFFKKPDTITVRKLTSNATSRLKLLQRIDQPNPNIDDLAETIQSDAAISFRLLSFLNSAAFGLPQKIKSVHHAIRLLGWDRLKNWLRVILLNDMSQAVEAGDLLQLSAQRGKFLELVARSHDYWGFDPESLHLLGLFSLMDTLLNAPMEEVVAFLPIEQPLKNALCGDAGNEYLPLIRLAQCAEEGRWEDADAIVQQLNLDREKVTAAFREALAWTDQLLSQEHGA
ncbi:HDOD domain-containing protein [uncultured Desulfosarcina sp.]|uniref:EAL and HDOD domain-containing protein n=1 Tax=uncultured Desulfosarcina sp. TaxID=218289 RepID=UPI0029C7CA87|nr:HDOD domain-containing protein [uncultured Desulfosarcina sp.]